MIISVCPTCSTENKGRRQSCASTSGAERFTGVFFQRSSRSIGHGPIPFFVVAQQFLRKHPICGSTFLAKKFPYR